MNENTISIVIPAFNEETGLKPTLEKLTSQSWYKDVEIIVVDDGSTDDTAKILAAYGGRLRTLRQALDLLSRESGLAPARLQLGQRLGVTGTPAILTRNGDLIPGYMQPEMLRARLDGLAAKAGEAAP